MAIPPTSNISASTLFAMLLLVTLPGSRSILVRPLTMDPSIRASQANLSDSSLRRTARQLPLLVDVVL